MKKKAISAFVLSLFLLSTLVVPGHTQEVSGSIVGRVYHDTNGDGLCFDTGEPGVSGIEVDLFNRDDDSSRTLTTNGQGTFRLGSATEGSWEVTVRPGEEWRVTSDQTRIVVIDDDEFDIDGVAFCITRASVDGTISGTVFRDVDANSVCSNTGEVGEPRIPVQLVNRNDNTVLNRTTDSSGYYEFSGTSAGTWQVNVVPGSDWRITSQQTKQVEITSENPAVGEVDFCIVQATTGGGQPVLPESGAPFAPTLLVTAILGLLLLLAGAGLFLRTR